MNTSNDQTIAPATEATLLRAPLSALKHRLFLVGVINALSGATLIALAALLARVLDDLVFRAQEPGPDLLLLVSALLVTRLVLLGVEARICATIGIQAGLWLRRSLVRGLLGAAPGAPTPAAGSAGLLLVEGIEAVEPFFAKFLPAVLQAAILPLAILAVALPLDLITAITLGATAPLIPAFMILIGKGAISLNAAQWAAMNRLSAYFLDAVRGLPLLRVFGTVERETRRLAEASEVWRDGAFKVLRVAFLSSLALEFFATLGVALVAVFIGFRLLANDMDYERGLFLLILAPEFYRPLRTLGTQYHARMEAVAAAGRLLPLMRDPAVASDVNPEPTSPFAAAPRVIMDGVRFAYGNEKPILKDFSLVLEPGTITAIVGASGVGKTTVIDLMRGRLTPDQGQITVNGRRPHFGSPRTVWVGQEPHAFCGPIRNIVTLGNPDATHEEQCEALLRANALDFVQARHGGLDSLIGEDGFGLSGGELRRLALARAFLTEGSLVLLDEPSASLDFESEAALTSALRRLLPARTVLVAAHRLSTIRAADRIVVLESGRIVEDGSFQDLLNQGGAFSRILGAGSPLVAQALASEVQP